MNARARLFSTPLTLYVLLGEAALWQYFKKNGVVAGESRELEVGGGGMLAPVIVFIHLTLKFRNFRNFSKFV